MKRVMVIVLSLLAVAPVMALVQVRVPGRDAIAQVPTLSELLSGRPMTTGFEDAVGALPMLDDFDPGGFVDMTGAAPAAGESLLPATAGLFRTEVESYCLMPGTARPRRNGSGYLVAPLKGASADIIATILERAHQHPEISQANIQLLLWGILSRARVDAMGEGPQEAAAALLSPASVAALNGGALGKLPGALRDQLTSRAGAMLAPVLDAEARMRDLLSSPDATYDEIEAIASPVGLRLPVSTIVVPETRWSFDFRGHFVRYKPNGYQTTTIEASVPAPVTIRRDGVGRVVGVDDRQGRSLGVTYAPQSSNRSDVAAIVSVSWKNQTFHPRRASTQSHELSGAWTFVGSAAAEPPAGLANAAERTAEDHQWQRDMTAFARSAVAVRAGEAQAALDLLRLRRALAGAVPTSSADLLAQAFQWTVCRAAQSCGAPAARPVSVVASLSAWSANVVRTLGRYVGGAAPATPGGQVLVPPGGQQQPLGPSNRSRCLSPEDQAKVDEQANLIQRAIEALENGLASDNSSHSEAPHFDQMNGDQFYDWLAQQLGGNVTTLGTYSNGSVTVADCSGGACDVLTGETWAHEVQHRLNQEECQAGINNGTCGDSGGDYARDELKAYQRGAEYMKNVKALHDKACSGNSTASLRTTDARASSRRR